METDRQRHQKWIQSCQVQPDRRVWQQLRWSLPACSNTNNLYSNYIYLEQSGHAGLSCFLTAFNISFSKQSLWNKCEQKNSLHTSSQSSKSASHTVQAFDFPQAGSSVSNITSSVKANALSAFYFYRLEQFANGLVTSISNWGNIYTLPHLDLGLALGGNKLHLLGLMASHSLLIFLNPEEFTLSTPRWLLYSNSQLVSSGISLPTLFFSSSILVNYTWFGGSEFLLILGGASPSDLVIRINGHLSSAAVEPVVCFVSSILGGDEFQSKLIGGVSLNCLIKGWVVWLLLWLSCMFKLVWVLYSLWSRSHFITMYVACLSLSKNSLIFGDRSSSSSRSLYALRTTIW